MATIGLDRLYYSKITEDSNGEETYATPSVLAKAITAELSVELVEAILYADDGAAEVVKDFNSGTLTLGMDDIGPTVAADLTGASTDDSCTSTIDTGIRPLCTTQTEFHDSVPTGCIADSGCFGSNQTLMIDDIQDCGFYKLCFHDRSDYFDEWFSRKYDSSFRNCINISGKFERS